LVFSAKDRRNIIAKEWQPQLWAYLAGICKNHEMIALAIGGTENHVHILLHLPPKLALAKAALLLKANSSKWMAEQRKDFSWQEGYGAVRRTSIKSLNTSKTRRHITGKPVSRANFARCFVNMVWNATQNTLSVRLSVAPTGLA
jgi:REP element-mobilizing transposase RayT